MATFILKNTTDTVSAAGQLEFNTDKKTEPPQAEIQNFDKVRKLLCDILNSENEFLDLTENILTLDELLDKINDKGFESLSKEEKSQLENYSKQ